MNTKPIDSILRFDKTVAYYDRYRPNYPDQVYETLINECQLEPTKIIVDIGIGTGIFAKKFLKAGNLVYGVEPNQEMRKVAAQILSGYANFNIVDGTAENTSLPDHCADFVTAAQVFHWLDKTKAKLECKRILKLSGWVVLVWNIKVYSASPLMQDYEQLLKTYGVDYDKIKLAQAITTEEITQFFYPAKFHFKSFPNIQIIDNEGLQGRLLSASYTPKPGDARYDNMLSAATKLFTANQKNGKAEFVYQTQMYYGQL